MLTAYMYKCGLLSAEQFGPSLGLFQKKIPRRGRRQAIYFSMGGWCGKFSNYMGHWCSTKSDYMGGWCFT